MKNKWISRTLITFGIIALIWFVAPLFFNKTVDETRESITGQPVTELSPDNQATAIEPTGTFTGVLGHQSSGNATLILGDSGNFIRLEDDFSVTSGPDLYVYVGTKDDKTREIARLKGNKGGQNYRLPSDLDPNNFDTIWVYCKAFSVNFAKAELK